MKLNIQKNFIYEVKFKLTFFPIICLNFKSSFNQNILIPIQILKQLLLIIDKLQATGDGTKEIHKRKDNDDGGGNLLEYALMFNFNILIKYRQSLRQNMCLDF